MSHQPRKPKRQALARDNASLISDVRHPCMPPATSIALSASGADISLSGATLTHGPVTPRPNYPYVRPTPFTGLGRLTWKVSDRRVAVQSPACPAPLSHQSHGVQSLFMAGACRTRRTIRVTSKVSHWTDSSLSMVVPSPSSPYALGPQTQTVPSSNRTKRWRTVADFITFIIHKKNADNSRRIDMDSRISLLSLNWS